MKLTDWAIKQGISYLTAYRWFKAGKLPVPAYQASSGTIIVQESEETKDELSENEMEATNALESANNNVLSLFLKKTVEFSKNNSSVEDFAAYVLSNFKLQILDSKETPPKYSRKRPDPEDIQKYFKSFIPQHKPKPTSHMFIPDQELMNSISEMDSRLVVKSSLSSVDAGTAQTAVADAVVTSVIGANSDYFSSLGVNSNTSINLTPQQFTANIVNNPSSLGANIDPGSADSTLLCSNVTPIITTKEIGVIDKLQNVSSITPPKKRGRKPKKDEGK